MLWYRMVTQHVALVDTPDEPRQPHLPDVVSPRALHGVLPRELHPVGLAYDIPQVDVMGRPNWVYLSR